MNFKLSKKGIILILVLSVTAVLSILSMAIVSRSINEGRLVSRYKNSIQAFWLAEAGISRGLKELKGDFSIYGDNLLRTQLGSGGYYVNISQISSTKKMITAHGFVPYSGVAQAERIIEAMVNKEIPGDFFGNALYVAGEAKLTGSAYTVTGNVVYGDEIDNSHNNVSGTITHDETISPLANLEYSEILSISQGQGNVYIKNAQNQYVNESTGAQGFPGSFWYQAPTDPGDPSTGVPNVVYVKDDLVLNGNIGTIGGFFVVVGNVISNPEEEEDTTINGNGTIEGVIYTRGDFKINGGGGESSGLNINGGVWAGSEAELKGTSSVAYNSNYQDAIEALNITPAAQIISWRDAQNPYNVSQ